MSGAPAGSPTPPAPAAGQVWATHHNNSRLYVVSVQGNGGVCVTQSPPVPGYTGTLLEYTAEVWADMVKHSGLVLESSPQGGA